MYKLNNNLLPENIDKMFKRLGNEKKNVTSGYLLPHIKTNFGKRSIMFRGVKLWKMIYTNTNKKNVYILQNFSKCYRKNIKEN